MPLTRREALQIGVVGAALAASGCRPALRGVVGDDLPAVIEPPKLDMDPTFKLLGRVGFGARPGDVQRVEAMGHTDFIEQQLKADQGEPLQLQVQLAFLDALQIESAELVDLTPDEIVRQLQQAALLSAVYSPNQLRERMADFWTNHFNIYAKKTNVAYYKGRDEWLVVRKHALGKFGDMVRASAKSPAMLAYLDNDQNRKGVPNENYARELLELHTLGVDGGYAQNDIQEVARCFSGWTIETGFLKAAGTMRFDAEQHDNGSKTVLGQRIPPGLGKKDVDAVIDILLSHPSTGKFIAKKLCLYLLGEQNEELEAQVAGAYTRSRGDIPSMLRPILNSDQLLEGAPILKRPLDFVVSALRATDADTPAESSLQDALRRMGQPSYEWPMPDGYPVDFDAWSGSMLARWNFAWALTHSELRDVKPRLQEIQKRFNGSTTEMLASVFFGGKPTHALIQPLIKPIEQRIKHAGGNDLSEAAALCIAAPAFQWR